MASFMPQPVYPAEGTFVTQGQSGCLGHENHLLPLSITLRFLECPGRSLVTKPTVNFSVLDNKTTIISIMCGDSKNLLTDVYSYI